MLLLANFGQYKLIQKKTENDWNPGTWVLIWEYSARAIQWIPTWPGLDGFHNFLCSWALDKSSLSIWRVKFQIQTKSWWNQKDVIKIVLPFCLSAWFGLSYLNKNANIVENHLNLIMLVFIGYLWLSTFRWVPICQGFSHFLRYFSVILYWQN